MRLRVLLSMLVAMFGAAAISVVSVAPAVAAGDANRSSCPAATEASPGFRSYLPDCRAYEMVTPPRRGGASADREMYLASPNGSRVIGGAFEAFAGAEGMFDSGSFGGVQYPNPYLLTRTSDGWAPTPLSPPVSQFNMGFMVAASTNLARTLWEVPAAKHPAEGGTEKARRALYLREEDGAFVPVGPYTPAPPESQKSPVSFNEDLMGASGDLGRLATVMLTERWPGDTTLPGRFSLYEYTGTDNSEPRLVGVRNEAELAGSEHVNEHAQLISRCGTDFGGGLGHSIHNAISPTGSAIFFTSLACKLAPEEPTVNEVYARVAGAAGEAGERTVAISEPSAADCSACVETTKANAEFQGASESGSQVFFTTTQGLLAGQSTSNLYEYDFNAPAGQKIKLVSTGSATPEVVGVAAISEDGSHVYFVAKGVLTSEPDSSLPAGQQTPVQGQNNLYVYDEGHVRFVATLNGEAEANKIATGREPGECFSGEVPTEGQEEQECESGAKATEIWRELAAQTTPNGDYVVFPSLAHLTAGDTSAMPQLFEYNAASGAVARVSIGQGGLNANGNDATPATMPHLRTLHEGTIRAYFTRDTAAAATSGVAITESGQVFFQSALALTPLATTGDNSVYEYVPDTEGGEVFLISDGHDGALAEGALASYLGGVTRSGQDVFFSTADSLLPEDANEAVDLYDARAAGGFPGAAPAAGCSGEACLGGGVAAPAIGSALSVTQAPGGNLSPPKATTHKKRAAKARKLTRRQRLRRALKKCRRLKGLHRRRACQRHARRRYGRRHKGTGSHHKRRRLRRRRALHRRNATGRMR